MRPYRGQRIDNGEWVNGFHLFIDGQHYIYAPIEGFCSYNFNGEDREFIFADNFIEVHPKTVGQSIGLKDKNDKDGWKADIVKGIHKTTSEEITGEIVWDDRFYLWGVQLEDWTMPFKCLIDCYDFEIIGNIHENPELLK